MGKISINDVEPGMILSSDVKEHRGTVLLAAGQEITEKSLKICRMWGVTEVDVQGVDKNEIVAKAMAQIAPERLQEAESKAKFLFRHADLTHPAMNELYRLCVSRIAHLKPEVAE